MPDLTALDPVAFDTILAGIYGREAAAAERLAGAANRVHRIAGDQQETLSLGYTFWKMTDAAALDAARTLAGDEDGKPWTRQDAAAAIEKYETAQAEVRAIVAERRPYDEEYARRPWNRFYYADTASGGHIHRSMNCSTCHNGRERTRLLWMVDQAGKTEADAVAERGPILCTVCFPSAPVELTNGVSHKAAARQAKRCAGGYIGFSNATGSGWKHKYGKCPTCTTVVPINGDGNARQHDKPKPPVAAADGWTPVDVGGIYGTLKTLRTATSLLTDEMAYLAAVEAGVQPGGRVDEARRHVDLLRPLVEPLDPKLAAKVAKKARASGVTA